METLATLGYNGQLLATQLLTGGGTGDTGNTVLQQATAGNSATHRRGSGDTGNTGIQRATAGNSATHRRGCWRHWQHCTTTGNCWQLSN